MNTLHISGRRWYDGFNTYHTVKIIFDGVEHVVGFTYGYGDRYLQTAFDWLEGEGMVKLRRYENGGHEAFWQWKERTGCKLTYEVVDVQRKKHLHNGGQQ